jgi:hypothetical protein
MTPHFKSAWAADLEAFLAFKRALGYPYQRAEFTLRGLDRFLVQSASARGGQLHESILAWLERRPGRKPISVAGELAVVRQFYAFLRRRGHRRLSVSSHKGPARAVFARLMGPPSRQGHGATPRGGVTRIFQGHGARHCSGSWGHP